MKTLLISLVFLFNQISYAACAKPVSYLREGQPAECNGYLFTPEKEKEVREYKMQFEDIKKLSTAQDDLIKTLDKRVDVLTRTNQNLHSQITQLNEQSSFEKYLYFGMGAVLGLLITKGIPK